MCEKTAVTLLQEYFVKNSRTIPEYELIYSSKNDAVSFKFKLSFNNHEVIGEGPSKKEAKQNTARAMLEKLGIQTFFRKSPLQLEIDSGKNSFNAIGALTEFCVKYKYPPANYVITSENGPPHRKEFTLTCNVGDLSCAASAFTKQDAKHLSASQLLKTLKELNLNNPRIESPKSIGGSKVNKSDVNDNIITQEEINRRKIIVEKFKEISCLLKSTRVKKYAPNLLFKNYHKIFKSDPSIKSNVLTALAFSVRENNTAKFESNLETNSSYIFSKLLEEMELEHDFLEVLTINSSSHIVILSINSSVPLSFLGEGDTLSEAKVQAINNAIRCFTRLYV